MTSGLDEPPPRKWKWPASPTVTRRIGGVAEQPMFPGADNGVFHIENGAAAP